MRRAVSRGGGSFTLIEVTLGLAILVLIFGVIFQLVQMSVLGADAAAKNSLRGREISGLFALVRQLCLDLPVRSRLVLEPRGGRGYDLVLSDAPVAILPERTGGVRSLRLALLKDPVGGGGIVALQEVFQATNEMNLPDPAETNTFELMKEVVSLDWRAFDPRDQTEKPEWSDPVKPAYLRMVLVRRNAGRNLTNEGIFWIPSGFSPNGQPPVDPVTRVPMVLTNAIPPPA